MDFFGLVMVTALTEVVLVTGSDWKSTVWDTFITVFRLVVIFGIMSSHKTVLTLLKDADI